MFGASSLVRTRILAVVGVAVLGGALAACSSSGGSNGGGGTGTNGGGSSYKVGAVLQLSGTGSVYADSARAGEKAGVTDVNQRNAAGRRFSLDTADAGSDPQSTLTACSRLVQKDKVSALVVFVPGPQLIACNSVAKRFHVPVISLSGGAGNICADNLVSLGLVPNQQSLPVVDYLLGQGLKSWYFFGADYSTPKATIAIASNYLKSHGGTVAGQSYEPIGTSDYSQDINKIVAAHPQVAFLNLIGNDDIALQKQWAADPRTKNITRVDILLGEAPAHALGAAANGIYSSNVYFSSVPAAGNNQLKSALKSAGLSGSADINAYVSYLQLEMLAAAVKKAGSTDGSKVIGALKTAQVDGPLGNVAVKDAFSYQPIYIAQADASGTFSIKKKTAPIAPQLSCGKTG